MNIMSRAGTLLTNLTQERQPLRTTVAPNERALRIRDRAVVEVLGPGVYWRLPLVGRDSFDVHDASVARSDVAHLEVLAETRPDLVAEHFIEVDLGAGEAALVYENDKLSGIQAPGSRVFYWKPIVDVRIERVDIFDNLRVREDIARVIGRDSALARSAGVLEALLGVEVGDRQVGLLYDGGVLLEELQPGYHLFWKFGRKLSAKILHTRWIVRDLAGQEILTRDRVSLRINLSATYRIIDAVRVKQNVQNLGDFIYRELQLALRRAVGTRTLDELLTNKSVLDECISEDVVARLDEVGVELGSIGVKDIILPGDMKSILNEVVLAEKTAQANNIRRREETAATRSLMNTAKLMADNPLLVRLKELEALEKVTQNIDRLTVYGGIDGVMQSLVSLNPDGDG